MWLNRLLLQRYMWLNKFLRGTRTKSTYTKAYLTDSLSTTQDDEVESKFRPQNFLLLRKVTRYEYEKQHANTDSEEQLKIFLSNKGSSYTGLLARHDEYMSSLEKIQESLGKTGLSVRVIKRFDYNIEQISWADVILTAGGDGTFLMAASKVQGHSKPVIGINTDPIRSEGYLCLSKKYSTDFSEALAKLLNGQFKWMWRQRIRLTMGGRYSTDEPVNLHDQELMYPEHRFWEHVKENEMYYDGNGKGSLTPSRKLPILALNEVYIGESLSARVSFYEMSLNDSIRMKQKSSGVTVCTGTGSTSWHFNINHVPRESVAEILKIANQKGESSHKYIDDHFVNDVAETFNSTLRFDPRLLKMAYSVRDPVPHGIFQVDNSRGFCQKITIKSRMWDGWVVVDGGISFRFNDGATLYLEMFEEDALRCVQL